MDPRPLGRQRALAAGPSFVTNVGNRNGCLRGVFTQFRIVGVGRPAEPRGGFDGSLLTVLAQFWQGSSPSQPPEEIL